MLKQADRVRLELEKKLDESKERLKEQGGAIQGQVSCLNRPKFEHLKRHCTAEIKKLCFFNLHVISTNTVAALRKILLSSYHLNGPTVELKLITSYSIINCATKRSNQQLSYE